MIKYAHGFKEFCKKIEILIQGSDFGDEQTKKNMRQELRERLIESQKTGRPLRVYCGYDPTAPDIHLGHTVTMRKLQQFQELGHQSIFLIGNFTGLVGDHSDKDKARPRRSGKELAENARTYIEQAFRILDPEKTEILYNADWLSKLSFKDVIGLAANFTVQQFLARDNFSKRQQNKEPIWLHEFLYALMQGYDAVATNTDVQLGGTEQLFNLMAGRKLQESFGQKPQVCLTYPILVGTDGFMRMSKSTGNYIGINETSDNKYGKTMSIPDSAMPNWFTLITRLTPEKIKNLLDDLEQNEIHPMDAKKKLAWEIVSMLDGDQAADKAAARFERVHQERQKPMEIPTREFTAPTSMVDVIFESGFAPSKSQARRLIQQGAVKLNEKRLTGIRTMVETGGILQVGKRHFIELIRKN